MKALALLALVSTSAVAAPTPTRAPTRTEQIVSSTESFLGSLTPAQLEKAQRGKAPKPTPWTDTPKTDAPGVRLGSLNASQRADAISVLSVALVPKGYQAVLDVMDADQALAASRPPFQAGVDFYFFAVIGKPSATKPWSLELSGHHLDLEIHIAGTSVTIDHAFLGAQPTTFVRDGKQVRPLGRVIDEAFALMKALDPAQQKQATLEHAPEHLVPGPDGQTVPQVGVCGSAMTAKQRALLSGLVAEWAGMLNDEQATPALEAIRAGLDRTCLAWHGPTKAPAPVYFRISGPSLHIELLNETGEGTGVQADGVNHVHSIYRAP